MLQKILCVSSILIGFLANAETVTPRIVGGEDAPVGKWTSIVALVAGSTSQTDFYNNEFCAGTLIDKDWVLTAAHCVTDTLEINQFVVVTGMHNLRNDQPREIIEVAEKHVHPSYSGNLLDGYDIALLRLKTSSSQEVMPLYSGGSDLVNVDSTIIGWGSTIQQDAEQSRPSIRAEVLQQANTKIIANQSCSANLGLNVSAQVMCTEPSMTIDTCQGDSGGPLYINVDGQEVQTGITSGGVGCAFGYPALYTSLAFYQFFINQYVTPTYVSGTPTSSMGAISGLWFDRDLPGIGFNFIQAAQGLGVYYYGYRDDGSSLWLLNNAGIGPTSINKGQSYQLDLNQPTLNNGGNFTTAPTTDATGTSAWGTVELTFTGCNTATAHLTGDDGEINLNLIRLTSIQGTSCID